MSHQSVAAVELERRTVDSANRFVFGRNGQRFLKYLTEERIVEAEKSLCAMLEVTDLKGKSFLDVRCGSGLAE